MNNHPAAATAPRRLLSAAGACLGCVTLWAALPCTAATADGEIAAVCSRTSADYVRSKLPNGSFAPEYYAFGEGGHYAGPSADSTIDRLPFLDIARKIADPLAVQNYLPSQDPAKTKLLIMVYWGTSAGSGADRIMFHPGGMGDMLMTMNRDVATDVRNARLLGYDSTGVIGTDYGRGLLMTAFRNRTNDLLDEIADNRYFVVLLAFDFQLLWKEKQTKILWETRFSLREYRNDFGEALPAMAKDASRYFGQATHGLIRTPLRDPRIELGELKSLGAETPPATPDPAKPSRPTLPPDLAQRIGAYDREKITLQSLLAAAIKDQPAGADTRRTIENFNADNAQRIAALSRLGEKIRGEIALLHSAGATLPPAYPDQPLDTLRREFTDDLRHRDATPPKVP